jgi:flagellar biosynthesis/type III secretory pathway protein FliH
MVAKTDPMIKKAVELLEQLSQDEKLRAEAKQRAKALSDYNTLMEEARDEGKEQGIKLGKEQGIKLGKEQGIKLGEKRGIQKERKRSKQEIQELQERTAHIMKEQNLPLQIIANALRLTLEEVEGL